MSLKLPTEIIKDNPGIGKVWKPNDIGYLFSLKLVRGQKKQRRNYVEEKDIVRLFSYRIS